MAPLRRPSLLLGAFAAAAVSQRSALGAPLDLSNWVGQLADVIGDATVLDLSLPGVHDALTYDLSDTVSDGYEGFDQFTSAILHTLTPLVAGRFIRQQGQTQGITITQMLDAGVRFIDLRIMYSQAPDSPLSSKDWYSLHGCQSKQPALAYMKEVKTWLDQHPREIVVVWSSRHGDNSISGTDQYPATTPEVRQAFFQQMKDLFAGMMFDASTRRLNETSVASLWQKNQRVIWYAADYEEFTATSPLALDAKKIINELPSGGPAQEPLQFMRKGAATLAASKAQDQFLLLQMAASAPDAQLKGRVVMTFAPWLGADSYAQKCAASFNIPGMTTWCPPNLMDISLLFNYYNQRSLDAAYLEGESNTAVDFPNAIYLDAVDNGGLIRTGTALINPLLGEAEDPHATDGYAYSATLFGATVRRLCRRPGAPATACAALAQAAADARAQHPLQRWNDTEHGRLIDWPTPIMLPAAAPQDVMI